VNITLSVDEKIVEAARRVAQEQGTSLNELLRRYMASLAGQRPAEDRARALVALFEEQPGDSKGAGFTRSDAYAGRL
jgi:hypothetical protein